MLSNVGVEIVDVDDNALDDDDDDVCVLYSTPPPTGTTKFNAIPVDNYRRRSKPVIIDLSQEDESSSIDDDDVKLLHSIPNFHRRLYKGECSNSSNRKTETKTETPEKPFPLIFACEICVEEKPISDAFRVWGCNHTYCTQCISKYVASKLQDNITAINCPVPNCEGRIDPQHCRFILPKEVFDRWGDALCEAVILGSERFYCPFKECSALLIDDGDETIVQSECPSCYRLFCAACKVPWHIGMSCADFQKLKVDERSNEDIMLMNLAKTEKWMRCPKCKFYVSRIAGCLFMRCRCGNHFCYNCGSEMLANANHYCQNCKR